MNEKIKSNHLMSTIRNAWLREHVYLVKRGVKPTSIITIKRTEIGEAIKIVKEENLHYHTEQMEYGWVNFWIYKNGLLHKIIKELPDKPETAIDHFLLGIIFGYDVDSILRFIEDQENG
jgi:hypothetical protein